MKLSLGGITDSSTIDYPKKVSSVVYLCGCPFRCGWCQNSELVLEDKSVCKEIEVDEIVSHLKQNFLIDAVCITGGEPLHQLNVIELLRKLKEDTDFLLKIDHNGFYPERVEEVLKYLDAFATDIKAPLNEKYGKVVGLPDKWKPIVERVKKTHELLKRWDGMKTARTTIVPGLIDSVDDIKEIANVVRDVGFDIYTLQQFRNQKCLNKEYEKKKSPSLEKMRELGRAAKELLSDTKVRIVTQQNGFEEI